MFYKVEVQWGNKRVTHYTFTYNDAKQWLYKYPAKDVLAVIKRIGLSKPLAVRYYR